MPFEWYGVIVNEPMVSSLHCYYPDSKVHGANMGPIWDRQVPGGPHVRPMNFTFWVVIHCYFVWGVLYRVSSIKMMTAIKLERKDGLSTLWWVKCTMKKTSLHLKESPMCKGVSKLVSNECAFITFQAKAFSLFNILEYILTPDVEHIDGLVQERRNFIANALELRLSCINPLICSKCAVRIIVIITTVVKSQVIVMMGYANSLKPGDAFMCHWIGSLVHVMACRHSRYQAIARTKTDLLLTRIFVSDV